MAALSTFHRLAWFSFMFWVSAYTGLSGLEATIEDICEDKDIGEILEDSSENEPVIDNIKETNFTCQVDPTHALYCSWDFQSLKEDAQVTVTTGVCEGDKTVKSWKTEGKVGSSKNLTVILDAKLYVFLRINISLQDQWKVYLYIYDQDMLEVLSPPPNLKGSFEDSSLLVTWGLPSCVFHCEPHCLEYELSLGDQEIPKIVSNLVEPSYTEPNADLTQSYTVRVRTRKKLNTCLGSHHWSDWSESVVIPARQSTYSPNPVLIAGISLGIPMILLALLLLVRCQSVSKFLFGPIPCPPPKYLHALQNSDAFVFPDLTVKHEEENVLVVYSEEEKTHKT